MTHPEIERKLADMTYQRQFQRLGLPLLLMLAPPGVFAAVTYIEIGYVSPLAAGCALATYALVSGLGAWSIRRELVRSARARGDADPRWEPPPC